MTDQLTDDLLKIERWAEWDESRMKVVARMKAHVEEREVVIRKLDDLVIELRARVEELERQVADVILDATNAPITNEINAALGRAAEHFKRMGSMTLTGHEAAAAIIKLKEPPEPSAGMPSGYHMEQTDGPSS